MNRNELWILRFEIVFILLITYVATDIIGSVKRDSGRKKLPKSKTEFWLSSGCHFGTNKGPTSYKKEVIECRHDLLSLKLSVCFFADKWITSGLRGWSAAQYDHAKVNDLLSLKLSVCFFTD